VNIKYRYQIWGTAAKDQTWECRGNVKAESLGNFMAAISTSIGDAFQQLTQGRAVYGHPGVGCNGPYRITRMVIEEE